MRALALADRTTLYFRPRINGTRDFAAFFSACELALLMLLFMAVRPGQSSRYYEAAKTQITSVTEKFAKAHHANDQGVMGVPATDSGTSTFWAVFHLPVPLTYAFRVPDFLKAIPAILK
jgi:hypothetical protein